MATMDRVRSIFDGVKRQKKLATDLECFRKGGSLSTIHYIANANSIHVAQWLNLFAHTDVKIVMQTANPSFEYASDCFSSSRILPNWLKLPMLARYVLAGLVLRFSRPVEAGLIHAHSASGNGFVAWLSGRPYVIGAYGSEIFASHERGFVYRWLLRQILHKADRIQVASTECTKVLQDVYGIPKERIYCFHLGLDEKTFHGVDDSCRHELRRRESLPVDEPIWVVNRRTHPHYRTQEVVEGFLKYCESHETGHLALMCGEHQPDYTEQIREIVRQHAHGKRVTIIDRMLTHPQVAEWLQLADFAISVPKTDMFSVSTYQALGCGAISILSNLESYDPLRACQPVRWMDQFEPDDFARMFHETASSWPTPHDEHRQVCMRFTRARFSTEKAIRDIASFYRGVPFAEDEHLRWAA